MSNSKVGRPRSTPKVTKSGRFDIEEWELLKACFLSRTGLHFAGPSQILNHIALEYRMNCEEEQTAQVSAEDQVQAETATDISEAA